MRTRSRSNRRKQNLVSQTLPQTVVVARAPKEVGLGYLFLVLLGCFGAHQFYLGKTGRGLLYLFTLGLLGVGVLVDLFTLPAQTRQVNAEIVAGVR
jgi:TM2 domain-containing membrane protein YozV